MQVRAVNGEGDGAWSATVAKTPELSEKTRATIVDVRGDDGALAVTWNAPTEVVDTITTYDVRYILTSADETVDSNWTVEDDAWGSGRLEYGITGLTNGVGHDVQVRAVDSYGDGPWSDTMSATPADFGDFTNFADSSANATVLTLETASSGQLAPLGSNRFWGKIDSGDEDFFKLDLTSTHVPTSVNVGFWIYTLGDLDTVGEVLDENGDTVEFDDFGGVLPDPENFFIWRTLDAGTYYIRVTGYGSEIGNYVLRVRTFEDTTSRSNAAALRLGGSASGMIDPEDESDYFKLELSEAADVILRGSGFPDTVGALYRGSTFITDNDDGYLLPGARNFLIRQALSAGTY